MLEELLERFRHRDRLALARLLSHLARGEHQAEIEGALGPAGRHARVVAVTGSAGVGKSTLVGRLIAAARQHGRTVAVLACDPQSPLSGGALLGDRFRMPADAGDDGVFIRSLAAASGRGAVAEHLAAMVRLLAAFGFDLVIIETVGAGQGDVTVRELADVVVLLLQPETGDALQWEKAGVLEVADVVVINKADLPGAEHVEAQVRAMLALSAREPPAIVRVSARTGEGIDQLWPAINDRSSPARAPQGAGHDRARLVEAVFAAVLFRARARQPSDADRILSAYERGILCPAEAAFQLVRLLDPAAAERMPRVP